MKMEELFKEREYPFIFLAGVAMSIFTKSLRFVLPLALLIYVPVSLISCLIRPPVITFAEGTFNSAAYLKAAFPYLGLQLGLSTVFAPLAVAVAASVVRHVFAGEVLSRQKVADETFLRWGKIFLTAAACNIIFVASAALIFPAVYFFAAFAFCTVIIVVREKWGISAVSYGIQLIRGRFFKTLWFLILIEALRVLYSAFMGNITALFPDTYAVNVIITVIIQIFGLYFAFLYAVTFMNWDLCPRQKIESVE
ncbi:hypothetical protein FACS189490_11120 [Clostridia bacterium]|nr:hypothetical protein FACS189490_11120 [Clostridia bacterium]